MIVSTCFPARLAAILLIAFGLAACGDDEAGQRKAFIEFLQTRIVAKPGVHVPTLTAQESAAFGDYAKHYAVITDFNAGLDQAVSTPMQQAIAAGTPRSLDEVITRRNDIAAVGDGLAKIRAALDRQLATADAAHAGLKQPEDLRAVYDAAYQRDVTAPAKAMGEILPDADAAMKSILVLADFIAAHPGTVKIQGGTIQTSDASLQPALAAMIEAVRSKSEAMMKARQRLAAVVNG